MQKPKISLEIIRSTLTVLFVSVAGGFTFYLLGFSFITSSLLFLIFQFILFSLIANVMNNYFVQKTKQKELDSLEPLSTILQCAYCNTPNVMTFLPDQDQRMEFQCNSCTKKNSVSIQFVVARTTEPVVVPSATNIPLIDEKD